MTTIFHNPRCSKSRAAVELLQSRGLPFDVVKYLENPPSEKELGRIVKMLGITPEQLVRKKEKRFGELELGDRPLSDQEWLAILAANPQLIERPIVVHDHNAAIGRPLENISELLDASAHGERTLKHWYTKYLREVVEVPSGDSSPHSDTVVNGT